jgi:UTP--glucose-1-phosphate uridylyltransferase
MAQTVRKAVIPAAGLGTRFLPATKAVPKELLPIVDVPTLQYVVEEAVASGARDVVVVNGRGKGAIEDHFDHAYELEDTLGRRGKTAELEAMRAVSQMVRIVSVRQKEPLGLGHAVLAARGPISDDETFAVLLGDDVYDAEVPATRQLIEASEAHGTGSVALMEVPDDQTHKYGIVAGSRRDDGTFAVEKLVEKPAPGTAPSNLAIVGRYVLPGKVFAYIADTPPGHGGEIQLTDALQRLADEEGLTGVVCKGVRHDAGDKIGWLRANLCYALKRDDLRGPLLEVMRALLEEETKR